MKWLSCSRLTGWIHFCSFTTYITHITYIYNIINYRHLTLLFVKPNLTSWGFMETHIFPRIPFLMDTVILRLHNMWTSKAKKCKKHYHVNCCVEETSRMLFWKMILRSSWFFLTVRSASIFQFPCWFFPIWCRAIYPFCNERLYSRWKL
jgi:hypothetical protein